ncbi:MAG: hypothetical protein IANPNBLG_00391 [Bryobacteraceae bacterium]|nr:hypothetical protein [Bryobacteraceae bacterium]
MEREARLIARRNDSRATHRCTHSAGRRRVPVPGRAAGAFSAAGLGFGRHCHGGQLGAPDFHSPPRRAAAGGRRELDGGARRTRRGRIEGGRREPGDHQPAQGLRHRGGKRGYRRHPPLYRVCAQAWHPRGRLRGRHHDVRVLFPGRAGGARLDAERHERQARVLLRRSDFSLRRLPQQPRLQGVHRKGAASGRPGHQARHDPFRPDALVGRAAILPLRLLPGSLPPLARGEISGRVTASKVWI